MTGQVTIRPLVKPLPAHYKRFRMRAFTSFVLLIIVVACVLMLNTFVPNNMYCLTPSVKSVLITILPPRIALLFVIFFVALLVVSQIATSTSPQVMYMAAHVSKIIERNSRLTFVILLVSSAILSAFIALVVLKSFPNSGDEYAFIFQALTFLQNRLWVDVPNGHLFFSIYHILDIDDKRVSEYAPGWPGVIALGLALGIPPALMAPLSGIMMLVALVYLARRVLDWPGAIAVCLLVTASGFFLLNAGSHFSHVFTAFLMIGFAIFASRFLEEPTAGAAMSAGAFLGALGITRYYSAILCFLPFLVSLAATLSRRHYLKALWATLTIAPFFIGLLIYNDAVTGSPLTTAHGWGYPGFRLGLWGVSEFGTVRTPIDAISFSLIQLTEFMEWTSPFALLGYGAALAYLVARRKVQFYDAYFIVFVAGFLLYPDIGGNRYGPRYYFEAYPFLVLAVVRALADYLRKAQDLHLPAWFTCLSVAHLLIAAVNVPAFLFYMNRVVIERIDLYDQVAMAGLDRAVVFIASSTGVLRPMEALDLTRNGTSINGSVIYALDLGARNRELAILFPDRTFWRYERRPDAPHGHLGPWRWENDGPP